MPKHEPLPPVGVAVGARATALSCAEALKGRAAALARSPAPAAGTKRPTTVRLPTTSSNGRRRRVPYLNIVVILLLNVRTRASWHDCLWPFPQALSMQEAYLINTLSGAYTGGLAHRSWIGLPTRVHGPWFRRGRAEAARSPYDSSRWGTTVGGP